jgi:hypothetical protein
MFNDDQSTKYSKKTLRGVLGTLSDAAATTLQYSPADDGHPYTYCDE